MSTGQPGRTVPSLRESEDLVTGTVGPLDGGVEIDGLVGRIDHGCAGDPERIDIAAG